MLQCRFLASGRLLAPHHEPVRSLRLLGLPEDRLHGLASQIQPFCNRLSDSGRSEHQQTVRHDIVESVLVNQSLRFGLRKLRDLLTAHSGLVHNPRQRPHEEFPSARVKRGPLERGCFTVRLTMGNQRKCCGTTQQRDILERESDVRLSRPRLGRGGDQGQCQQRIHHQGRIYHAFRAIGQCNLLSLAGDLPDMFATLT